MNVVALKAPAQSFTPPAWATLHNAEMTVGALVIILLVLAVLRLSKGSKAAPAPAPTPRRSGGGGKLLLIAGAAVAGLLAWGRYKPATTGVKAAPAPSPSPSPTPTVTRTVAPRAAPHFTLPVHLTGGQYVLVVLIGAVVAIVLLGPVLRKRGD